MPPLSEFDKTQQSVEVAFAAVDHLIEQGKSRRDAIDHTCHRYGIQRHKLVALLNDRDAGILGGSGEMNVSVQSTPTLGAGT